MSIKSRHLTTIASIAFALALLGLFFVAGTHQVRAQEQESEAVAETVIPMDTESLPAPAPMIEETKVDTEATTVTEEVVAEPEPTPETPVIEEATPETSPEVTPAPAVVATVVTPSVAPAVVSLFAISNEFGNTSVAVTNPATGNEGNFTTGATGEGSFTTSGPSGGGNPDEHTFTTLGGGGGCTTNCGGGCTVNCGGGGCISGCGGGPVPPPPTVPQPCPLYLREFIRLGQTNNQFEVRKLQAFLNVFEGEHLAITGFYSQADFDAVSRFQAKYLRDVLTPWGIGETTGYVFITTRLAINNVYCNRSTANDLDLRNYYPTILNGTQNQGPDVTGLVLGADTSTLVSTSAPAVATTSSNIFQAAAIGFLNFFKFNPGGVLIGLLALAILFMFFLIWKLSQYPDTSEPVLDETWPLIAGGEDENEVVIEDDPETEIDIADEDPTQPSLTG